MATPYRIPIPREPIEEGQVVIRSLKNRQPLITAFEVLSPTNKADRRGRHAHLGKREQYYRARANLVEIDLLRTGSELIDVPFDELPLRLITPYKAVVRRGYPVAGIEAEYYSFPLPEPLPRIAIPLRRDDEDVIVACSRQSMMHIKRGDMVLLSITPSLRSQHFHPKMPHGLGN